MRLLYLESTPDLKEKIIHYLKNNEPDFLERSTSFFILSEREGNNVARNIRKFLRLHDELLSISIVLNIASLNDNFSKDYFTQLKDSFAKL